MPTLTLSGCAPVPLAHYLKALGIFRLVSEQKDASTTGRWHRDQFVLESSLDREALLKFFLEEYQPTPIMAPWNGGSGFYEGDEQSAILALGNSSQKRLADVRTAIKTVATWTQLGPTKQALSVMVEKLAAEAGKAEGKTAKEIRDLIAEFTESLEDFAARADQRKESLTGLDIEQAETIDVTASGKKSKSAFIKACKKVRTRFKAIHRAAGKEEIVLLARSTLGDSALHGIDAMVPMLADGQVAYPPLFGSGGTDGRLEFTNKFLQCLCEVIEPASGIPNKDSASWLNTSLFQEPTAGPLSEAPIGQFYPGSAGGANSVSGFSGAAIVNPWDYILMMEGGMLFAGAAVKKLDSNGNPSLVCPFCVSHNGAGFASAARNDEEKAGCEIWTPMWDRSVTHSELKALFGEGRSQLHGKPAQSGVDFARAAVTLGVDRGVKAFQRYAILERNGQANFATPLGKFLVRRNARADLLTDTERWLARLRMKTEPKAKPKAPQTIRSAFNVLERSIIDLCADGNSDRMQSLLVAFGATERVIAKSFNWSSDKDKYQRENISPLSGLRAGWLDCPDTVELRLARSLAGMRCWLGKGEDKGTFWLRQQLEPVEIVSNKERQWVSWDKNPSNDVTWHDGDLTDSLNAILGRRIQRVEKAGVDGWPDWSPHYAKLDDITAFIEQRTDDALLADLLWGFSLLDWQSIANEQRTARAAAASAREAATEDTDEPRYDWRKDDAPPVVPSSFYSLLKLCFRYAGEDGTAIPLVPAIHQRARSGDGLTASRLASRRLLASGESPLVRELRVSDTAARRTAAALLFPISPRDIKLLKLTTQHQPKKQNA